MGQFCEESIKMTKITLFALAICTFGISGLSRPTFFGSGLQKRSALPQDSRFFNGNNNNNNGRRPPPGRGPGGRPGGRPGGFGRPPVQQTQNTGFNANNPFVLGGTALAGAALGAGAATILG